MTVDSGPRNRTRQAILRAAASVLSADRTATLADIAAAADVGRSTLHRYFSDRDQLIKAVIEDSGRVIETAVADAEIDKGGPEDAMRRLIAAMVETGDHLLFLFGDEEIARSLDDQSDREAAYTPQQLIERGQADGVFDPELSPDWIESVLWALVYTGCEASRQGSVPRHSVPEMVARTLEHGIRPRHR